MELLKQCKNRGVAERANMTNKVFGMGVFRSEKKFVVEVFSSPI